MEKYTFKIDGKSFEYSDPLLMNQENGDFTFLELFCNFAPVYYLYKNHEDKELYENLQKYAYLSMCTCSLIRDIKDFVSYTWNIFNKSYFGSSNKSDAVFDFIRLIIEKVDRNENLSDLKSIANARSLISSDDFNSIGNEIIALCNDCKKNKIKIYNRILKLLSTLDDDLGKLVIRIKRNLKLTIKNVIHSLLNYQGLNGSIIINKTKNIINKCINTLSQIPSKEKRFTDLLERMCKQVLNPKWEFSKKYYKKCLAIITHKGKEYFAISGKEDYINRNITYKKIKNWADEINTKIFDGKATWCNLSDNTSNYINYLTKSTNESNFSYLGPSLSDFELLSRENNKDEALYKYTCCERKILGFNSSMQGYSLYVLKKPCFKCTKALNTNVKKIFAYFDSLEKWKIDIENDKHFFPKEYKISLEYISQEIK